MEQENRVPCPYCKELILQGALKCKECGTTLARQGITRNEWVWYRNQPNRKVLGVAACVAANCRVSATLVRLVFVLLTFVSLLGLLIYVVLAAVIPAEKGGRSWFEAAVDGVGAMIDDWRKPSTSAVVPPVTTPDAPLYGNSHAAVPPEPPIMTPTPPLPHDPYTQPGA